MKRFSILIASIAFSCTATKVQDINGTYQAISIQNENSEPCNLSLVLKGTTYKFKGETNAKGTYSISNNNGKEKFITFTGLKYAQVDDRYQNEDSDISGALLNDTIIIQNYGNSMNDFITLGVCDEKYIYLVRSK